MTYEVKFKVTARDMKQLSEILIDSVIPDLEESFSDLNAIDSEVTIDGDSFGFVKCD